MTAGGSLFLEGRMFLLRGAEAVGRRRGGHASVLLYRQGYRGRPVCQKCNRRRLVLHILQVRPHALYPGIISSHLSQGSAK